MDQQSPHGQNKTYSGRRKTIEIKISIPEEAELAGESMVISPLQDGTLNITIPDQSIPYGLFLMGEGVKCLSEIQNSIDLQRQKETAPLIVPANILPPRPPLH